MTTTATTHTSNVAKTLVHVVEIQTPAGPMICEQGTFVNNLRGARKLAKAMAARFETRILLGGQGGMEVK